MSESVVAAAARPVSGPPVATSGSQSARAVRLQTRGPLHPEALYVQRSVDTKLATLLSSGQWVLLLGPKFSGKSSLRLRTARALQAGHTDESQTDTQPPHHCGHLELRNLQATSAGAVYQGLCTMLAADLRLPSCSTFWQHHSGIPPVERFVLYLREEVLARYPGPVTLFFDDIEALRELPLPLDELWTALRVLHEARNEDKVLQQLRLCLSSSHRPEQLCSAVSSSVFSVMHSLLLPDFSRAELADFAPALTTLCHDPDESAEAWLDAIYDWTGGQPYWTQHLCQQLVARAPSPSLSQQALPVSTRVQRTVQLLLLRDGIEEEPCLLETAQRARQSDLAGLLFPQYRRLLSGGAAALEAQPGLQLELLLCGLATDISDGTGPQRLRPRNQVLTQALDEEWAREQEVRQLLAAALAGSEDKRGTLRGAALKTAQAWARRHPEALRPDEVQVLLTSLEAARAESEAKHQSSAVALQKQLRERGEPTPVRLSSSQPPTERALPLAMSSLLLPRRTMAIAAGLGTLLVVGLLTWAAAARHQATQLRAQVATAAARAVVAEQAAAQLQARVQRAEAAAAPRPPRPERLVTSRADRAPNPSRPVVRKVAAAEPSDSSAARAKADSPTAKPTPKAARIKEPNRAPFGCPDRTAPVLVNINPPQPE